MKSIYFLTILTATVVLLGGCAPKLPQGVLKEDYIHKYGVAMSKKEWNDRGNSGKVISTLENGATVTKTYEKDTLHGTSTITFPHSLTIEKTEIYDQGKLTHKIEHFTSGIPMWEEQLLPNGKSLITTWYEDGTPQSYEEYDKKLLNKGEYYSSKNEVESRVQQQEGTRIHRDAYGNLLSKDLIKDGEITLRTTYHPNGDPKTITSYINGLPTHKKTFWLGGQPNTIEQWHEGEQSGITIVFQNGEKRAEIPYVHGKKHGAEKRFRENEILAEELYWENDKKHGPARTHINGKISTKWYLQDKLVSKLIFDEFAN